MKRPTIAPTITSNMESQRLRDLKGRTPHSLRATQSSAPAPKNPPAAAPRGAISKGSGSGGSSASERRSFARFKTLLAGMVSDQSMQSTCRVLDLSLGGARIGGLDADETLPERFSLRIDRFGLAEGRLLWQRGDQAGVRFEGEPTTIAALFGAFLPKHCRETLIPLAAG